MNSKSAPEGKERMEKPSSKPFDTDVAVIGGGVAGCALTAILAAQGIKTCCIDRDAPDESTARKQDMRTTAISFGSRNVLRAAGVWDDIAAQSAAIKTIHILDGGRGPLLEFNAADVDADAFGWIVENADLKGALFRRLASLPAARHMAPATASDFSVSEESVFVPLHDEKILRAKILVGADGRHSMVRETAGIPTRGHAYEQSAAVCIITHENPHNNIAIEDFRPEGPFAVLPMPDDEKGDHRSSVVWSQHAPAKFPTNEKSVRAALQERLPAFYGRILSVGKIVSYPLSLSHAHRYTARRIALIGDAAHGIHPIAGQGLNLGLRDVAAFAELVIAAHKNGNDIGGIELLNRYESMRRPDNMLMAGTTDTLNALFSNRSSLLAMARRTGLRMVSKSAPLKTFFMKQAMGASGFLPTLIRTGSF